MAPLPPVTSDNTPLPGGLVKKSVAADLQGTIDWYRANRSQSLAPSEAKSLRRQFNGMRPPQRAILLQDLHGGGKALAALLSAQEMQRIFVVCVVGMNPVEGSGFRLTGYLNETRNPQPLFSGSGSVSDGIPVLSTAEEMEAIIRTSMTTTVKGLGIDVKVTIGNPFIHQDLVYTAAADLGQPGFPDENSESIVLPDPDDPDDKPKSYTSCWIIEFTGKYLDSPDNVVTLDTTEDDSGDSDAVRMKGLSTVVIRKSADHDTGETDFVTDVMELATPTPLKAGVKVVLLDFVDIGWGVIASGYRDMDIDQSEVPPSEAEEEDT